MAALYQLAVLGAPTYAQINALEKCIKSALDLFNLQLGNEVRWEVSPAEFEPHQLQPAAVVFFGGKDVNLANLQTLLERGIPIVPVVTNAAQAQCELPELLHPFNYFDYSLGGAAALSTTLLESVGLVSRQRKVFLSYCREELIEAATQLCEMLSARQFEVILDSDDHTGGSQFSHQLWHKLCDSDVLVMLDTPTYFERRWTNAEFGRALAKGISVLRVSWPDSMPSPRASTASWLQLLGSDINPSSRQLEAGALQRICLTLEEVRSQSYAVRYVNLRSKVRIAAEASGGKLLGVGAQKMAYIQLSNGTQLKVALTLGVPTPNIHPSSKSDALIYDHIGLHRTWLAQDTLAEDPSYPWVRANEADLHFSYCKGDL